MGTSEVETIKEIQGRENIFVAYSQTTKLPYVTCGEETLMIRHGFLQKKKQLRNLAKRK